MFKALRKIHLRPLSYLLELLAMMGAVGVFMYAVAAMIIWPITVLGVWGLIPIVVALVVICFVLDMIFVSGSDLFD